MMEEQKPLQNEKQKDVLLEKSIRISEERSHISLPLIAWCSEYRNKIRVIDRETKHSYADFDGVKISDPDDSWTHVKEITNTKLLVSLHHNYEKSANMEIFDISKKGQAKRIYSFEEVSGDTGYGDVTYNSRRGILAAISIGGQTPYHLFDVDTNTSNTKDVVKLIRKSKWPLEYSTEKKNFVPAFDFNPTGESIATMDHDGICLISNVNTNDCKFNLVLGGDHYGRCRWSTNPDEPILFAKYSSRQLNILDVEKGLLTLKNPIQLEPDWYTYWIDVCPNNGNLLASCGEDNNIKIFDKRKSKVVKTFEDSGFGWIYCVRWNPDGDMLAIAPGGCEVKLLDFKTGKVFYTSTTSDENYVKSACFI